MTTEPAVFSALDDGALLVATKQAARDEQRATATLLRALGEVDRRRLYLADGCASLFTWCTQVLHLSEGGAYNRIEVARAARAYPVILDLVADAVLTLTAVRLLAPHLTPENHQAVLEAARHQSRREVETMVAALHPKPDAATVIRRVPIRPLPASPPPSVSAAAAEDRASVTATVRVEPREPGAPLPMAPACVAPLAPDRYRLQVTVSRETHDRLCQAQALLRHAVPTGDVAAVLDRALTLLVTHLERQRFADTVRPRASRPAAASSRHIPAAVRRAVWRRDHGRCAFTGHRGRCTETAFLEFHHVEPYARGGPATVANLQLRCRAHNSYEARLCFGAGRARDA